MYNDQQETLGKYALENPKAGVPKRSSARERIESNIRHEEKLSRITAKRRELLALFDKHSEIEKYHELITEINESY